MRKRWEQAMATTEKRVIADCRQMPSENNCSLTIAGREEEVLPVAIRHAVEDHGHEDTAELREQIRSMLKEEVTAT
jgi:predicted small metal-binding protein